MSKKCVKCGYVRQEGDTAPDYECPKCGVIYSKAESRAIREDVPDDSDVQISGGEASGKEGAAGKTVVAVAVVLVVALAVGGFGYFKMRGGKKELSQESVSAERELIDHTTKMLIRRVKANLKDPESAQINGLQYFADYMVDKKGGRFPYQHKICGEINAKNSYGGYVGFRPFVASMMIMSDSEQTEKSVYARIFEPSDDNVQQLTFYTRQEEICRNTERPSDK